MAPEPSAAAKPGDFVENSEQALQIEETLRCRLGHRILDLRLWTEPHGFVLSGCSRSYYDKQLAQQTMKEISGFDVADNRIVVDSRAMDSNPVGADELTQHGPHAGDPRRVHRPPHRHRLTH
jgi:hypothetical protein